MVATCLSPAEERVADLLTCGLGNKEIAAHLQIAQSTVDRHLQHIYDKLGLPVGGSHSSKRVVTAVWWATGGR